VNAAAVYGDDDPFDAYDRSDPVAVRLRVLARAADTAADVPARRVVLADLLEQVLADVDAGRG
jgi:hypothetical protein